MGDWVAAGRVVGVVNRLVCPEVCVAPNAVMGTL